jgi:RNA polymerase sigma-70 factor (ECF subfamily)
VADAEDLAQEAFVQAHQQLGSFRSEARFSSWLCRIAINLCLNWRKRQQRRERVHEEWNLAHEAAAEPNKAVTQAVQDALMQLPPKQRAAVVLTVYDGLNHAEAARVLGCSEATVSWRLFAARGKLKRLLKDVQRTGGGL